MIKQLEIVPKSFLTKPFGVEDYHRARARELYKEYLGSKLIVVVPQMRLVLLTGEDAKRCTNCIQL